MTCPPTALEIAPKPEEPLRKSIRTNKIFREIGNSLEGFPSTAPRGLHIPWYEIQASVLDWDKSPDINKVKQYFGTVGYQPLLLWRRLVSY